MVMAFDKRVFVGKGYECNRLIKKWEKTEWHFAGFPER